MQQEPQEIVLNRRSFLHGSAALAALGALPQEAAAPAKKKRTLVVVFLRGGCDGLNLVVPHGDPDYASLRRGLAVPGPGGSAASAVDIDGYFGLHPAAGALAPLFQRGVVAAAHAVGHPANTRSHFEEQDRWELAQPDTESEGTNLGAPGWLGRYLALAEGVPRGPIRALALGRGVPRSLRGPLPALAISSLSELTVPGDSKALDSTMNALRRAYAKNRQDAEAAKTSGGLRQKGARSLLERDGAATLGAMRRLAEVAQRPFEVHGDYPSGQLGAHFLEAARLIDADLGLEVIQIDHNGFDTHQNQAGLWGGLVTPLAQGLAAFEKDITARGRLDEVLVLTISEFGRTARPNGTQGTDHGSGGCVLALGGAVRGKEGEVKGVVGDWPTLAKAELLQNRDLRTVTDIRNVYAEALTGFMGVEDLAPVLPGWTETRVGLIG